MRDEVERVCTRDRCIAIEALEAMNADTDDAQSVIPRRYNLVVYPLAISGRTSHKDDGAGLAIHLIHNPALNRRVAALCDRFPLVIGRLSVPFDCAYLPYLRRAGHVGVVVKTAKAPPGNRVFSLELEEHDHENRSDDCPMEGHRRL